MHIRRFTAILLVMTVLFTALGGVREAYADPEETNSISYVSVSVSSDLTLNIGAKVDAAITAPTMKFSGAGKTETVSGTKDGEIWVFAFGGIYAQCLSDVIQIQLLNGETVLKETGFSIRQYFDALYAKTPDQLNMLADQFAALKKLMADILEYGAMAQLYEDYNTSELANSPAWVATEKTAGFSAPASDAVSLVHGTNADKITGIGLTLSNYVRLRVRVKAQSADRVVIAGEGGSSTIMLADCPVDNGTILARSAGLPATAFDTVWTVTLTDGEGTVYSQLKYSVNSYVAAMCESETANLARLVKTMYNYGVSAEAYKVLADAAGDNSHVIVAGADDVVDSVEGGDY